MNHGIFLVVMNVTLTLALLGLTSACLYREKRYQAIIQDLLDRVMARSYGEYVQGTKIAAPQRARRRQYLDDAALAEMERQARGEIEALAAAQGAR